MKSVVYVSTAQHAFDEKQLIKLAEEASASNHLHGVTGYLFYQKNTFIQYIESENESVPRLLKNIRADRRHELVFELEGKPIAKRRFPHWGMKFISRNEMNEINLEKMLADALTLSEVTGELDDTHVDMIWHLVDLIAKSELANPSSLP